MYLPLLFDALPRWLAVPLLQLGLLVAGMALEETYVNRATVLAGALALAVHAVVAGRTGLMVGLYLDVGLVIGAYGSTRTSLTPTWTTGFGSSPSSSTRRWRSFS